MDIRKGNLQMSGKHTLDELNQLGREELVTIILTMQGQLDALNENIERLIEQVRIANQHRFGRKTETMQSMEGQLSFFNEADALYDKDAREPEADEVLPRKPRRKKAKGQRDTDLKEFPEDIIPPMLFPKKRWMLSMALAAGGVCRMRPIKGSAMSRSPRPWKSIQWKYMWGRMESIRMNSCAAAGRKIFSVTALSRRLYWHPS